MRAVWGHGVELIVDFGQKHLPSFNAFHFGFLLLSILKVDARQAFELVFGRHDSGGCGEGSWEEVLFERSLEK